MYEYVVNKGRLVIYLLVELVDLCQVQFNVIRLILKHCDKIQIMVAYYLVKSQYYSHQQEQIQDS